MIETKTLLPGVTLRTCRDDRFKQGCLSFQLVRPMAKEESAKNVLIPSVLLRGTKRCPDLRAITENLDELYGASVSPLVRRVGDYQTTGLYCGFMDDRFALPGDRVLAPMLRFLEEILLDWLIPQIEHRPFIVMSRSSHSWKIRWHSASLSFMTFPPCTAMNRKRKPESMPLLSHILEENGILFSRKSAQSFYMPYCLSRQRVLLGAMIDCTQRKTALAY